MKRARKPIKIDLTVNQLFDLDKLFRYVEKHPAEGMILGQVKENGEGKFSFLTPEDLQIVVDRVKKQQEDIKNNLFTPLR